MAKSFNADAFGWHFVVRRGPANGVSIIPHGQAHGQRYAPLGALDGHGRRIAGH
jgi:hypothetical protein